MIENDHPTTLLGCRGDYDIWRNVIWAIWGKDSGNGGSKVIKTAPEGLKEKYRQVFA